VYTSVPRLLSNQQTYGLGSTFGAPAHIASHLLQDLRDQAETELSHQHGGITYRADRVVLAVPLCMDLRACQALREAAQLAGIEVVEIFPAPLAAMLYHIWQNQIRDGVSLVYSWGAGSFDVCVLRRVQGELVVLGLAGDPFLGGIDLDRHLVYYLVKQLREKGFDLSAIGSEDPKGQFCFAQLVQVAEKLKCELSANEVSTVRVEQDLLDRNGKRLPETMSIKRSDFEQEIGGFIERSFDLMHMALEQALDVGGIKTADIDHVHLVGGATQLPLIQTRIQKILASTNPPGVDGGSRDLAIVQAPSHAVAAGAALRAATFGLGMQDDRGRAQVWIDSSVVTDDEFISCYGHLETASAGESFEQCSLYLTDSAGNFLDEVDIKTDGRFLVEELELTEQGENPIQLELLSEDGMPLVSVEMLVYWMPNAKQLPQRGLTMPVLLRDIVIHQTVGASHQSTKLLAAGSALPGKSSCDIISDNSSDTLFIQVLYGSRLFKTIKGNHTGSEYSPTLELTLSCDACLRLSVQLTDQGQAVPVELENPPPEPLVLASHINVLEEQFDRFKIGAETSEARQCHNRFKLAVCEAKEALAWGDQPKAQQRVADIESLLDRAFVSVEVSRPEPEDVSGRSDDMSRFAFREVTQVSEIAEKENKA
jgi:hypothetical protein